MAEIENKLVASARDAFGKGAARKLRAVGQTPAVLYGHGEAPRHFSVETHPLSLIVRQANALIELDLDGEDQLALVKDVQRDPVRQVIEHVDLLIVKKGEKVEVEVPIVVEGEPFSGSSAFQELNTLLVKVPAVSIPENYVVDVEGLEEGTQIFVKDLEVGKDTEVLSEEEELVVQILVPIVDTESDADAEAEEPEVVGEAEEAEEADAE